jgi:hypothetical protein
MIIDLTETLKDKYQISDVYVVRKLGAIFSTDNILGYLFSIPVLSHLIDVGNSSNNDYWIAIYCDVKGENISIFRDLIEEENIVDEIGKAITYLEKYDNLKVFS